MPNRKRRILVLGDARQVHLARWVSFLLDTGYDVLTVSLEPIDTIAGSTRRVRVPGWLPDFLRYPLATPTIRRVIGAFRPDLVSAHFLPNYGLVAALGGHDPWVLSTWGSDIMVLPERSAFHLWRTRFVLRRATHVTSDAQVMTERLRTLGVEDAHMHTFPYGVDRRLFHPPTRKADLAGPRLLSNRKLEPVYNLATVLEAFRLLAEADGAARLTVAGSGSERRRLQTIAHPKDRVRFVGQVLHADMPALLGEHDIFVSAALSDTTSVSLLEAMACGLFPIVGDIPATREWIDHGTNGFLVPPMDATGFATAAENAWNDADLRRRAAVHNQDLIRTRADWSENMSTVVSLFDELIARAAKR